ncbi:MAG: Hpt domain-containing protein [Rhodobacter sp.]|nr:Hpt domain-containing protein [Rhodobacter sp.]
MIDWNRVCELREEIGADDFLEVVEIFLEEVDEIVDRLASTPDPARFEEDLHFLKGSALNIGFSAFATSCAEGESKSANGAASTVDLPAILQCYRESRTRFLTQLETEAAA